MIFWKTLLAFGIYTDVHPLQLVPKLLQFPFQGVMLGEQIAAMAWTSPIDFSDRRPQSAFLRETVMLVAG